jgi:putative ABC transport system substrate-binding protein
MSFDRLKRREFITLLGGAAAAWPLAVRAQRPAMPVIGFLNGGFASERLPLLAAFRDGLKQTEFIESSNLRIDYRWGENHYDRLPTLAADLVLSQVAVIVTSGTVNSGLAAKAATSTIPIVFVHGSDPIGIGLVTSLSRPGGNVTGVTLLSRELEAKRLDILHELIPKISVIGFLVNSGNPNTKSEIDVMNTLASARGWRLQVVDARSAAELDSAFATLAQQKADAFLFGVDALFGDRRAQIAALAASYAIPGFSADARSGGLISYSTSNVDAHRQVGIYAGRILKGEKPADLPVRMANVSSRSRLLPLPERTRQQRKRLASPVRSSRGTTDARFSRREGYGADAARSPHSQVRVPHPHRELGTRRPDARLSRLERAQRQNPVRERGRRGRAADAHPGKHRSLDGSR